MNVNQIVNMVIRRLTHVFVNKGVDAGIDLAARRGRSRDEMTDDERAQAARQAQQGKSLARRARQIRRIMRRLF